MARRAPKAIGPERPLSRQAASKNPLPIVYIFCEGKITEPEYIMSFFRDHCKDKRKIVPEPVRAAGVPYTLIEKAVKKKNELRIAGRSDSIQKRSCVWAVFDVDVHPKLDEAIALARANDIPFCVSNPCIEIWGLLHLGLYERPSGRHDAQAALAEAMPPYHHDSSPVIPWEACRTRVKDAVSNAKRGLSRRASEGQPMPKGNPSTNFHELLGFLNPDFEVEKAER